ncbi:hypothetical protein SKAU_G00355830 [Synaphobranchus kaupii]|uniref:Uncharacterized protein n=1 Tax=Synaphobranchus kaupii TaxID=118154 RepID=A0A9Q1EHE2_SYNKA|nr:hypothetical protein SKAU_G00355830 [Synaphobranchus kaupii]
MFCCRGSRTNTPAALRLRRAFHHTAVRSGSSTIRVKHRTLELLMLKTDYARLLTPLNLVRLRWAGGDPPGRRPLRPSRMKGAEFKPQADPSPDLSQAG